MKIRFEESGSSQCAPCPCACWENPSLLSFQWETVQYFNNKIICDLVEERHRGIISILVRKQ
jgi:hypothetical protein